jgi:hypothetical protein
LSIIKCNIKKWYIEGDGILCGIGKECSISGIGLIIIKKEEIEIIIKIAIIIKIIKINIIEIIKK